MESPIRKMLKRNDYNRHKLLRKIKRRRKAEAELQKHSAEKELKKRLKITPPKFDDGKLVKENADIKDIRINEDGTVTTINGNTGNVVLPELTVRAHNGYKSAYDRNSLDNVFGTAIDVAPIIGDAKQGIDAIDAFGKGNYGEAAMLGGLMFLPNVIEKPFKYVNKGLTRGMDKIIETIPNKYKGYGRIFNDALSDPIRLVKDYRNGDYPITYSQRKLFLKKRNEEVQGWINDAMALEKELFAKRLNLYNKDRLPTQTASYDDMFFYFDQNPHLKSVRSSRNIAKRLEIPTVSSPNGSAGLYWNHVIDMKNRDRRSSNFNNFRNNRWVFNHEFTHDLQDTGGRYLTLNTYDPDTGYYVFDPNMAPNVASNAFDHLMDRSNSVQKEYIRKRIDPNYVMGESKNFVHAAAPDEAIADWRAYRLSYPNMASDVLTGNKNFISKYFEDEYGLTVDDLIELHDLGFDKGKNPKRKIITKKEITSYT